MEFQKNIAHTGICLILACVETYQYPGSNIRSRFVNIQLSYTHKFKGIQIHSWNTLVPVKFLGIKYS